MQFEHNQFYVTHLLTHSLNPQFFFLIIWMNLTTIYFENNTRSDLKEFGFSKDGKSQHVQINLALIVTEFGLPIGYEVFKGNLYEGKTLLPVLKQLRDRYRITEGTIVADSAMLSTDNLKALTQNQFHYVVAARIKNVKSAMRKQVVSSEGYIPLNDDLRYKVIATEAQTLVVYYSEKRARKDQYDQELSLRHIEKFIGTSAKGKFRGVLKKSYVTLNQQSVIALDQKKLEEASQLDGYFGFYTNTELSPEEVIAQYRGLWQVEQSFRITKHNLSIRPVYHYTDRRIKAHFALCFLALALIRTVEHLLRQAGNAVAIETLHQMLSTVKSVQLISGQQELQIIQDLPKEVLNLYQLLGISTCSMT